MIPIVSIGNLVSFLVSSTIALKLYFSYRKEKEKKLGYFFKSFLFLSLFFGLLATPQLLFTNLILLNLIFHLSIFFLLLAIAYFIIISLELLNWEKIKRVYFWGIILFAVLITVINFSQIVPAAVYQQGQFIFFEDVRGLTINIVIGLIVGSGTLSSALFFFINGFKTEERYLRLRSFVIGSGVMILALTAGINYIAGASTRTFLISIVASSVAILGLLTILAGIYYKKEK